VPDEILESMNIFRIKINYKSESKFGSKIKSSVSIEDLKEYKNTIHKITADDKELCLLEAEWK
jgi:acyl-ACP thioesterase